MTNVGGNNSHSGGVKIPEAVRDRTQNRILAYAKKHYLGNYTRIDVRFQGQLCYIDAYLEPYVPYAFDPSVAGESSEVYIERKVFLSNKNVAAYNVFYCHSTRRSSYTYFAFRLMGYNVRNYDDGMKI